MKDKLIIKGARQHNLKNIDVEIPRDKLVVLTGLSADSCVLATAQGANMREYAVWVPQDAVAAITPARRRHALQVMAVGLGARVDAVRAVTGLFPDPA